MFRIGRKFRKYTSQSGSGTGSVGIENLEAVLTDVYQLVVSVRIRREGPCVVGLGLQPTATCISVTIDDRAYFIPEFFRGGCCYAVRRDR